MRKITMLPIAVVLVALAVVVVIACGTDEDGGAGQPTATREAGVHYNLTGVDPASLCFDLSALPENFVSDGETPFDNETAAGAYTYYTPEPDAKENVLAQYEAWGRLGGHASQWSWAYSAPREGETPSAVETREEQERQEAFSAPYLGAACRVDLYRDQAGAAVAYAAMDSTLWPNPAQRERDRENIVQGTSFGSESLTFVTPVGAGRHAAITFREGNVLGYVVLLAGNQESDLLPPLEEFAQLVLDAIRALPAVE